MNFKKNTKGQNIWLVSAFTLVSIGSVVSGIINGFNALNIISALTGVVYNICLGYEDKYAYFFGIVCCGTYGALMIMHGLYAAAIYNIAYSIPIMIYGFFSWNKLGKKEEGTIKTLNSAQKVLVFDVFAIIFATLFAILTFIGGKFIVIDAMVTALAAVASFLITKKYIEQWWIWALASSLSIILFVVKSIYDPSQIPLILTFVVYCINNIYAYIQWDRKLKTQKNKTAD